MKNSLQKIPSFVRFHKSKGIRKEKKGLHSISKLQFIIHHLHIEDMLYKNTQVKPWIQYEIIFSLAYLVRRHSGVCQMSFSPLTWTSLKLTLYRKKNIRFPSGDIYGDDPNDYSKILAG